MEGSPIDLSVEEEVISTDRTKSMLVLALLWIAPAATLVSLFFNVWTLSQTRGGPAVGTLLFSFIALGVSLVINTAIWWFKWIAIQ